MNDFIVRIEREGKNIRAQIVAQPEAWRERARMSDSVTKYQLVSATAPCIMRCHKQGLWLRGMDGLDDNRVASRTFGHERDAEAWVENTTALVEMFGAVVPFEDEKQEEKDARP